MGLTLSTVKLAVLAYLESVFAEQAVVDLDYRRQVQFIRSLCEGVTEQWEIEMGSSGWGGAGERNQTRYVLDLSVAMVLSVSEGKRKG